MARSRRSAKDAGARFERQMADWFAQVFDDDRIDRMVRRGANDAGDIAGIRAHGRPVAVECKNVTRLSLPEWVKEARKEASNSSALAGVVVSKRHGVGDPARQWVHMEARDFVALILGVRID